MTRIACLALRKPLPAVALVLLAASGARADDLPAPADSIAAVLDECAQTLRRVGMLAPALGIDAKRLGDAAACDIARGERTGCTGLTLEPCARALAEQYGIVRSVGEQPSAGLTTVAALLAREVAAAALRANAAARAVAAGRCERVSGPGEHPTRVVPGASARTMFVEPLTPLRIDRSWALVIDGLSPDELARVRARTLPQLDGRLLRVPPGSFADPLMARLQALGGLDLPRTTAFIRSLEQEASGLPGLPASAGVWIVLPAPLSAEQLGTFHAYFAPAERAVAERTVVVFPMLDVRAGLRAYRAALAELPCEPRPTQPLVGEGVLAGPFPHVAALLRTEYASLDLGTGAGAARVLGTPPDAEAPRLRPALLALPGLEKPVPTVVVLVHGLRQTAASMLASHAEGITARGMAALAIELPQHGERSDGSEFLDELDPAALARHLRQATVDVMAAVRAIRSCGATLPDGRPFRPTEARYAGYSLGAMIGTIVRSVEPAVGAMVLFAPGGDLPTWLGIRVASRLGSSMFTCIGGSEDGRSCLDRRECAAPGVCYPDPSMLELSDGIRLPYALATAGGEPLAFAGLPAADGAGSAPLLMLSGGTDTVLPPHLVRHLAEAYGMQPVAPHRWRGPDATLVEWPQLGHELSLVDGVRAQAYDFLASPSVR